MKFNEQWLREWVNPAVETEALAHQLTMAGLEVDAIEPVAAEFSQVVVGEVVSVEPHPDADRLRVCLVDVGEPEPLTIVCGASNVAEGMKVPTALIGAVLPGGLKIKKSKLRGVRSFGMLCSSVELGLEEQADGLMPLPSDAEAGVDVRDYLQLNDVAIEIGLTPNRGDCLSLLGIAREVGVVNSAPVSEPSVAEVVATIADTLAVTLADPKACPRYVGRVIKGINPNMETPLWMRERLRRCGLRSVSPVVDVTNYVMLELGQPMHAFDLGKLSGGIHVRAAGSGEKITLLDGQEVVLRDNTLVIADDNRAVAMAGIMGGDAASVTDDTQDIFLESAFFARDAIVGRPRQYGLHTDSSYRFERGVDFDLPVKAMKRASALLLAIVGGEAGPIIEELSSEHLPARRDIVLRAERISSLLGIDVSAAQVTEMLTHLGMKVTEQEQSWIVTPPSFRFDIAIEADLVEEVGRIYGYDNLPTASPVAALSAELEHEIKQPAARVRQLLVDRGYQEAITYSFVDPKIQRLLLPDVEEVALANPLSAELSVMRTSLWPGLVQALSYNQNRQQSRVRFFEVGVKFSTQGDEIREKKVIAGLVCGSLNMPQWGEKLRAVDYYDLKADVEALLSLGGGGDQYCFTTAEHSALHPGQTASISRSDGAVVGWLGALHPSVARQLGINDSAFLFELDFSVFSQGVLPVFSELSRFPAIKRDIALVVSEETTAQQVQQVIAQSAGDYLSHLELFDVYRGEGIEKGRKSMAMGLTFQDTSRTLTDQEVEALISTILGRLTEELQATLRE